MNENIIELLGSTEFFWVAVAWLAAGLMWTSKRIDLANRVIEHIQRPPIEPDPPAPTTNPKP